MPYKNNYFKMLLGERAQILISGAVAYTSQADLKAFAAVAGAAQGELGCFDTDTLLLVSGGGAASTTENICFAVKRDGLVNRTISFKIGELKTLNRTAYSAQVAEIAKLTVGGYASLVIQDITYTAKAAGTGGNAISIVYVVAGTNTALSVSVTGNAITVNLATGGGGAATTTATLLLAAIVASAAASALVGAEITGTAATIQVAAGVTNLANGVGFPAVAAGQYFELGILETTPGNQPFPTWAYGYTALAGDTIDSVLTNLTAQINVSSTIQGRDLIVTATYDSVNHTMTITAINFGVTFRILAKQSLANNVSYVAPLGITYPTPMHLGSGFGAQVLLFEQAGWITDGVTTNYPEQGSLPADYGQPASLVNTSLGYNIYAFKGYGSDYSKTPLMKQDFVREFYVIVPSTGATPEAQVKAILGL